MRKLLLFLIAVSAIGISSCTRDDVEEISQVEKELLVEQMLVELNESVKTGKYQQFIIVLGQKSSTESLSEAEMEALFLEILGEKSQTFLNLFLQLKAINMTGEEFTAISEQFKHLISVNDTKRLKKSSSDCDNQSLICAIINFLSEINSEGEKPKDPKEED